jgi:hypothetical protein
LACSACNEGSERFSDFSSLLGVAEIDSEAGFAPGLARSRCTLSGCRGVSFPFLAVFKAISALLGSEVICQSGRRISHADEGGNDDSCTMEVDPGAAISTFLDPFFRTVFRRFGDEFVALTMIFLFQFDDKRQCHDVKAQHMFGRSKYN